MGRKRLEVLKYDKAKAKNYFILFKFFELFGVFLFFVGFHALGSFIYNKFPQVCSAFSCEGYSSYFELWFLGFMTFLIIVICLGCIVLLLLWVYLIFRTWFRVNWRLAKLYAEDEEAKKERLKEEGKLKKIKEIEELEEQRKRWGYCVEDEAKYINKDKDAVNRRRYGQKCKILKIDNDGNIYPKWEDGSDGGVAEDGIIYSSSFKFIKKPLPKKPKLSKVRQEEIKKKEEGDKHGK